MQASQTILRSLFQVLTCAALVFGLSSQTQAQDKKADANGTWTWSQAGRQGGDPIKITLKLKVDGEKVTGTLTRPGRGGGAAVDTAIEEGKIKGDEISFNVVREGQNGKVTTKYHGKVSGDSIKGKSEGPGRGGETQSRDWEAKRDGEKK